MKTKNIIALISLSLVFIFNTAAQQKQVNLPAGWRAEEIKLPLSFAPDIPITGLEEVRFAPGWGDAESEEYFSYAFVWFLDDPNDLTIEDLEYFLIAYFDGIMGMVGGFEEVGTFTSLQQNGDFYKGELNTLDGFFTKSELILNFTIERLEEGKVWFFRLSPQPMDHAIWEQLNDEIRLVD
ncbi:MAG: hypothetical protein R8G66_19300 [Cytophagales bacterium]|nr:hypothetical protein [Cytophagales bacterium]